MAPRSLASQSTAADHIRAAIHALGSLGLRPAALRFALGEMHRALAACNRQKADGRTRAAVMRMRNWLSHTLRTLEHPHA